MLFNLFLDLVRQLIQLTLGELQQLSLLLEFLLTEFPAITPDDNDQKAVTVQIRTHTRQRGVEESRQKAGKKEGCS